MFTFWHRLFSFVPLFPGVRIETPPTSTVQGKCLYTFLKAENQEIQRLLLGTKSNKDKHKFMSFRGRQSRGRFSGLMCLASSISSADLLALRATIVESSESIQRPSVLIRQDFWADLSAYCSQRVKGSFFTHLIIDRQVFMSCINGNKKWQHSYNRAKCNMTRFSNFLQSNCDVNLDFSPVELAKVIYKYAKRKIIADFLFSDGCNVCSINLLLRDDICSRNIHYLDLDLYNWPRSNVNVPIKSQYTTSNMQTIVTFALSVTICEINTLIYRNGLD